jgi:hypothetical protein
MLDFEKNIEKMAIRLPKLPSKTRKNIYDIFGVQRKETVNSRVLSYFLDSNEEHQFDCLFFDSLKELIKEKKQEGTNLDLEIFSGNFKVINEDQTFLSEDEKQKQKRIDISIEGDEWCIVIENKIDHRLNNPLRAYWEHAEAKFSLNVIGVVLSIKKLPLNDCIVDDKIRYINITHKELITRVQEKLLIGTKTNSTSLFYLKEYIKNIESHYQSITDEPKMNEIVNAIVKQGENTKTILDNFDASVKFIDKCILEVFESFDFVKQGIWFKNNDLHPDIYFWIHDSKTILLENRLWFCFETRNETDKMLNKTKLKDLYRDFSILDSRITFGNADNSKSRTHIAKYSEVNFLKEGESFKEKFTEILEKFFMNPKAGIVNKTVQHIKENLETSANASL